jgi:hypothetical protein
MITSLNTEDSGRCSKKINLRRKRKRKKRNKERKNDILN